MKNNQICFKGEIYYADFGLTVGSEQAGKRPVIIVQNDVGNEKSTTTIVVPLTKTIRNKIYQPTHILINATGNLQYDSIALVEQIRVIDKQRLVEKIGTLNSEIIKNIDNVILKTFGIK